MSLAATVLQNVRHRKNAQKLDQWEHRVGQFGFLRMFEKDTPNLLSAETIEKAKTSATHVQQAVVTKKGSVTINNTRSCTIAAKENTSALLTFTWATYSTDFTMSPYLYFDNEIQYVDDMAQKMLEADEALAIEFEELCIAAAIAGRTKTAAYNAQNPYPVASDSMVVDPDDMFDFYNQLKIVMKLHNFRNGKVNIVGSTLAEADVIRYGKDASLKKVGSAISDSDEGWQLFGYDWNFSDYIPPVGHVDKRIFASAPGAYAIMNWNPKTFGLGGKTTDGHSFELTPKMPLSGMELGHQFYSECLEGDKIVESHQFSTDVCVVTAYNSTPATIAGPIFEARVLGEDYDS